LDRHQETLINIILPLGNHVKKNSLGKIRTGPAGVYLDDENIFEPDIMFISNENLILSFNLTSFRSTAFFRKLIKIKYRNPIFTYL